MYISLPPQAASKREGLLVAAGDQQTLSLANREAGRIQKNMHIV